jgi:uncharacterized SAM-binding protein YcdF (DUF218 family)
MESDDAVFEKMLEPLWLFLAPLESARPSDVIFVFGGLGMEIPRRAAELYRSGVSSWVLVSGASGPLTQGTFTKSEAAVFRDEMVAQGVPASAIILEESARNSGQNVEYGMHALAARGIHPTTVALVSKSFIMRRAIATFERKFPDVVVVPLPPIGPASMYVDRPRAEFAQRLLDELKRLEDYETAGFIAHVDIPPDASNAATRIRFWLEHQ